MSWDPNQEWRAIQLLRRLDSAHNGGRGGVWVIIQYPLPRFHEMCGDLFGVQAPIMTAALAVGLVDDLVIAGAVRVQDMEAQISRPALEQWVIAQKTHPHHDH